MNGVIHIGAFVVDTTNQGLAARVAKAAASSREVRGRMKIDGAFVRWSEALAFHANGGFEKRQQGRALA